jgi:hypothetical protein
MGTCYGVLAWTCPHKVDEGREINGFGCVSEQWKRKMLQVKGMVADAREVTSMTLRFRVLSLSMRYVYTDFAANEVRYPIELGFAPTGCSRYLILSLSPVLFSPSFSQESRTIARF